MSWLLNTVNQNIHRGFYQCNASLQYVFPIIDRQSSAWPLGWWLFPTIYCNAIVETARISVATRLFNRKFTLHNLSGQRAHLGLARVNRWLTRHTVVHYLIVFFEFHKRRTRAPKYPWILHSLHKPSTNDNLMVIVMSINQNTSLHAPEHITPRMANETVCILVRTSNVNVHVIQPCSSTVQFLLLTFFLVSWVCPMHRHI